MIELCKKRMSIHCHLYDNIAFNPQPYRALSGMKVLKCDERATARFFNTRFVNGLAALCAGAFVLVGCGGGGGGGATTTPTAPPVVATTSWAAAGNYSPVLKFEGALSATAPLLALSLVHPSSPTVEYVVDAAGQKSSALGLVLARGTYNSTTRQVQNITSVAYVDAPGDVNVRTTSLEANGQRPAQSQSFSGALCSNNVFARNFSNPYASQILMVSPGRDSTCGTADDGQALVTFSASGVPSATPVVSGRLLGYFASGSTGIPANWLSVSPLGQVALQPIGVGATSILSAPPVGSTLSTFKTVLNLSDLIVYTQNGLLRSVSADAGLATLNATLSTLTGPEGWQAAGSDATHAYLYINSLTASSGTGTWRLFSLSRSTQTLTALASGPGSVLSASANSQRVFATVINGLGSSISVVQVTAPTGIQTTLVAPATGVIPYLSANPSGSNLLGTSSQTAGVTSTVFSVVNNAGAVLYSAGKSVLAGADNSQYDLASQVFPLTSFIFYSSPGNQLYAGSSITRFNSASGQTTTLGTVPTGASLGGVASDLVFSSSIFTNDSSGFGGVQIARVSTARAIQPVGNSVYTFNTNVPNSLIKTTEQVR